MKSRHNTNIDETQEQNFKTLLRRLWDINLFRIPELSISLYIKEYVSAKLYRIYFNKNVIKLMFDGKILRAL